MSTPFCNSANVVRPLQLPSVDPRFGEAEQFVYGRINYERQMTLGRAKNDFKLDTITHLLQLRGNAHLSYPVIHVAGTKGKGSVTTMIAAILTAAGYRVGVYRSPHLESICERIEVDGQPISPSEFADRIDALRDDVAKIDAEAAAFDKLHPPTFFELLTIAGFEYFAHRKIDIAVVEVGLGGRLDSTNVCAPAVCVITNIGIDHQAQLGGTREKIAFEKAGIIKPSTPVICGLIAPGPAAVIAAVATSRQAPVSWLGRDFHCAIPKPLKDDEPTTRFSTWSNATNGYEFRNLSLKLYGVHQAINGALAVAVSQQLVNSGWQIEPGNVRRGLARCDISGRFQTFLGDPAVVVDIAHNEISVRAFARALQRRFGSDTTKKTLVFSASRDKKILPMMRLLFPLFDQIVLSEIADNPRACPLDTLKKVADRAIEEIPTESRPTLVFERNAATAWLRATESSPSPKLLVVCGSAFFAGQMLPIVRHWHQQRRKAAVGQATTAAEIQSVRAAPSG